MVARLPLVTDAGAFDVMQRPVKTSLQATTHLVLINTDGRPVIVAAVLDNDTWSRKLDGN